MGWLSPEYTRILCKVRLWNRLVQMDSSRLTKNFFEWDWLIRRNNWSSEICSTFLKLDSDTHFYNQDQFDFKSLKERVWDLAQEEWRTSVKSFPKLRSYNKFKTTSGPKNYILISISKSVRSLLVQLRCGVLPLAIETGRFTRKDISERKCIICNSGAIEDEQHFICNCTLYDDFRINFFNDAEKCMPGFLLRNEEDKFTYICPLITSPGHCIVF